MTDKNDRKSPKEDYREPCIVVREARENNLRSIDVDIPHNRITVITGVSGSGKSSLAFDVIHQEARRRYLESFSTYARQFMGKLRRPEVGRIDGLSPVMAVGRQVAAANPRSTVGTLTELYDFLRLLYARLGEAPAGLRPERRLFSFNSPHGACPVCHGLGVEDRIDPELLIADPAKSLRSGALAITTPSGYIIYSQVTMDVLDRLCRAHGFSADVPWRDLTAEQRDIVLNGSDRVLIPYGKHPLASRMRWKGITAKPREEGHYKGILPVMDYILRTKRNRNILRFARTLSCRGCGGKRLRPEALRVTFRGRDIAVMNALTIRQIDRLFREFDFDGKESPAGEPIREAVLKRTEGLLRLGLDYLELSREAATLSGGESQRIRLATQAGSGLRGVTYILDEPTTGLHPADIDKLFGVLEALRDNGNTVIVVEHDETAIRRADHLVDLGPGAGENGGALLYSGAPSGIARLPKGSSLTSDYLSGERRIPVPARRRGGNGAVLVRGARKYNLKNIDVAFKLGAFNAVTGVSGAGKSTLVKRVLAARLREGRLGPGADADGIAIEGRIGKIIEIDSSPIGRTPRSNPATYTKLSDLIRNLFAALPEARARGWDKGRFSFNVAGGRCETCQGAGLLQIGMHFLGDVDMVCPHCDGRRFNEETLAVRYRRKNIDDILDMSVDEAASFFHDRPRLLFFLEVMIGLGLGYLRLGQSSTTLSGGEAQRIKLAAELARRAKGAALYILEEPTTGLHFDDVKKLLDALQALVDKGHTIIAIEHHPDFIKAADHVIDLGPGSGEYGGEIVAAGTPEIVAATEISLTGRALRKILEPADARFSRRSSLTAPPDGPIRLNGVTTHNLKDIDVAIPFNRLTVVSGPSGSGKSSLVFDSLFAESRERYIESFSAYVRGLIDKGGKADIASAWGLTPPIAISQKAATSHPRSTVGTMTEIHDYLRLLFSRAGTPPPDGDGRPLTASAFSFNHEQGACPRCKGLGFMTVCDPERLVTDPRKSLLEGALDGTKTGRFYGEPHGQYIAALRAAGRAAGADFSKPFADLDAAARRVALYGSAGRTYDIVWSYKRGGRSGEHRFHGPWKGFVNLVNEEYERKHADHRGEAMLALMKEEPCPACGGRRLKSGSLAVTFRGKNIADLSAMPVSEGIAFFEDREAAARLDEKSGSVWVAVRKDILRRLALVRDVGLEYLTLDRRSSTLSGGEAQRLRLAGQLGAGLMGITYILDEPSIGLHPRDTRKLIGLLKDLVRQRNTVVVVEHDADVIAAADHVIDMGPGAGREGGKIVAQGSPLQIMADAASATGRYLAGRGAVPNPLPARLGPGLRIKGASAHNLRSVDIDIPSGGLTAVTGVSGSGKSSLIFDVLLASARAGQAVQCAAVEGLGRFDRVFHVNQEPPGGGSSSTPVTYAGLFDTIRGMFAAADEAKALGYGKQHFSFLTKEGRCETCGGSGAIKISMDFLADVRTPCEDCGGSRYKREILDVHVNGKNIAEVLALTTSEAVAFFSGHRLLERAFAVFEEIGLGYLQLGQPLETLSGGEAQRLKLAAQLMRPAPGMNLYLLDEPTIGLHDVDVKKLLGVLARLIDQGQTLVVVEHNLDVIARSHHVIDLGPEGGDKGGTVIACGPPAAIAAAPDSFTGAALRDFFS
jgi:excinuclease ABC subunit A